MSEAKETKSKVEVVSKTSEVVSKTSEVVAEKVPTRIYLGPNLPGGRLLQATVFRGGIPAYLEPLLDELPDVSALIVPVAEMSTAQERIRKAGTAEHATYQSLLKGVN